jgi:prefoldin subunit 5
MTCIDYSIGFTVEEVEEILATQKAELKKTLTAYADNGSSVTKRRIDEIHTIIAACQQALQKLAPETYGRPRRRVAQSGFAGYLDK